VTLVGALVAVARPLNCAITALSVLVGALTSGRLAWGWPLAVAAASAALITGAGNAYNDLRDLDIDRINRPLRPLPSGRLSPRGARRFSALLGLSGLAGAAYLGWLPLAVALSVAAGLAAYSAWLKRRPVGGNLLVAAMAAAAFPYGALAMGTWGRSAIPALFALLFHCGRELIKDAEDSEGDRASGARTLALLLGPGAARWAGGSVFAVLAACTAAPALLGLYGLPYIAPVALMNAAVGAAFAIAAARPLPAGSQFLSRCLTGAMVLGLLSITLGELWPPTGG